MRASSRIATPISCVQSAGRDLADGLERRAIPRARCTSSSSAKDAEMLGRKQVLTTVEDLVEHRLRVGHRTADDLAASRRWRSAAPAPRLVSLNSRTFSIAITAWSAKVCSSRRTWCGGKAPGSRARHTDDADRIAIASAGTTRRCVARWPPPGAIRCQPASGGDVRHPCPPVHQHRAQASGRRCASVASLGWVIGVTPPGTVLAGMGRICTWPSNTQRRPWREKPSIIGRDAASHRAPAARGRANRDHLQMSAVTV